MEQLDLPEQPAEHLLFPTEQPLVVEQPEEAEQLEPAEHLAFPPEQLPGVAEQLATAARAVIPVADKNKVPINTIIKSFFTLSSLF